MNQMSIGEFMQQLRKQKNLTQRELAERIGVSDKTISKWETGNSIPDTSMLMSLCSALDISVNELLSCEKLPPEDYSKKAEENMMSLLKENETNRKSNVTNLIVGCVLFVLAFLFMYLSLFGFTLGGLPGFIDLPSFLELAIVCIACIFLSGAKGKAEIIKVLQKGLLPAGALIFLFSLLVLMYNLEDFSVLGPSMAVAVLPAIYALAIYVVLIPVSKRLEN
ncbi:MAG: helix-turn-helix domain-containing protein [Acetatifactor sp.]|nr:helix-turn-helix domain-containing protein [Acetatifactor sp.]